MHHRSPPPPSPTCNARETAPSRLPGKRLRYISHHIISINNRGGSGHTSKACSGHACLYVHAQINMVIMIIYNRAHDTIWAGMHHNYIVHCTAYVRLCYEGITVPRKGCQPYLWHLILGISTNQSYYGKSSTVLYTQLYNLTPIVYKSCLHQLCKDSAAIDPGIFLTLLYLPTFHYSE